MWDKKSIRKLSDEQLKELAAELSEEKHELRRLRDEAKKKLKDTGQPMNNDEWKALNIKIKDLAETLHWIERMLDQHRKRMIAREHNYY